MFLKRKNTLINLSGNKIGGKKRGKINNSEKKPNHCQNTDLRWCHMPRNIKNFTLPVCQWRPMHDRKMWHKVYIMFWCSPYQVPQLHQHKWIYLSVNNNDHSTVKQTKRKGLASNITRSERNFKKLKHKSLKIKRKFLLWRHKIWRG